MLKETLAVQREPLFVTIRQFDILLMTIDKNSN